MAVTPSFLHSSPHTLISSGVDQQTMSTGDVGTDAIKLTLYAGGEDENQSVSSSSSSDPEDRANCPAADTASDDEAIEYGSRLQPQPIKPMTWAAPSAPVQWSASLTRQVHENTTSAPTLKADTFGIAYKPMKWKGSNASDQVRRDGGFGKLAEEEELDGQSLGLFSLRARDGDGDRITDTAGDDFATVAAPSNSSALERASVDVFSILLKARQDYAQPPPPPLSPLPTPASAHSQVIAPATTDLITSEQPSSLEVVSADDEGNVWDAAQAALDDLTYIYGRGLGDHEVRSMDLQPSESPSAPPSVAPVHKENVAVQAIPEDGEDEAELQEEKEERAAALKAQERQALCEAWNLANAHRIDSADRSATEADKEHLITYEDALKHFTSVYEGRRPQIDAVQGAASRGGLFSRILRRRPRSSSMPLSVRKELDGILCMTEAPYDPTDPYHLGMIRRLYRGLTGLHNCPVSGSHWEALGFQGSDPRTDLNRSMGVYSLFQLLWMLEKQPDVTTDVFQTSQTGADHWPFVLVSIGFTRDVVEALRDGRLDDEARKRGSTHSLAHSLHQALLLELLARIRSQPDKHHAVHLAEMRRVMSKSGGLLVMEQSEHTRRAKQHDQSAPPAQGSDIVGDFTDLKAAVESGFQTSGQLEIKCGQRLHLVPEKP